MANNSQAKIEANNRYTSKAYDKLNIFVPKGRRSVIKAHAETHGQSINGLVNALLRADMGYSDAQWKAQPQEMQEGNENA